MNYGYVPNADECTKQALKGCNQTNPMQMYYYLVHNACIDGKHVLEVGSGRGGGARHITENFNPATYTGMDIADSAVKLASKNHPLKNLKFIQGSAESIPLADNSMDVIINVESCHAYGSVDNFLKEVKRVLKPGGHFLMVDFRNEENVENMTTLKQQLSNTGMEMIRQEDITGNVIRSIEAEDDAKKKRIQELVPARWQNLFSEFAGVVDSRFYQTLKNGKRLYYRFELRKRVGPETSLS